MNWFEEQLLASLDRSATALTPELREVMSSVSADLDRVLGAAARAPEGGLVIPQLLDPILRNALLTPPRRHDWAAVFRIEVSEPFPFGQCRLHEDQFLNPSRQRDGQLRWMLAPTAAMPLASHGTRINVTAEHGWLHIGFEFPEHVAGVPVAPDLVDQKLWLYGGVEPATLMDLDRLRARPWARAGRPAASPGRDVPDPRLPRSVGRAFLGVPMAWFVDLPRTPHGDRKLFWFDVPWDDASDAIAARLQRALQPNHAVFASRLPVRFEHSTLREGSTVRVPYSSVMCRPQGIEITGVRGIASGRIYEPQSGCRALTEATYRIEPPEAGDSRTLVTLRLCSGTDEDVALDAVLYPLEAINLDSGAVCQAAAHSPQHVKSATNIRLVRNPSLTATPEELWAAFRSGLLTRERCVTRADLLQFVRTFEDFGLATSTVPEQITFATELGRVRGALLSYTRVNVPLRPDHGLSQRDLSDAAAAMNRELASSAPMGSRVCIVLRARGTNE